MLQIFGAGVLFVATIILLLSVASVLFCVFAGLWFATVFFVTSGAFALVGMRGGWRAFRA